MEPWRVGSVWRLEVGSNWCCKQAFNLREMKQRDIETASICGRFDQPPTWLEIHSPPTKVSSSQAVRSMIMLMGKLKRILSDSVDRNESKRVKTYLWFPFKRKSNQKHLVYRCDLYSLDTTADPWPTKQFRVFEK